MKAYLSPLAEKKLYLIIGFIETKWGKKARADFLEKLKKSISLISSQPNICPESKQVKGLFRCVVSKQTSFYYRISSDAIEIITVIDNRQDPSQIMKELEHFLKHK